jgi:hypothetical protein
MEERGIFKDNEASPASAAAATPDSKKRDKAGQYESGSQAVLSSKQILSGTPFTEDFPASKRGRGLYNFNGTIPCRNKKIIF